MDLVTPDIGLIFWTTLTFLLLVWLLGKFAWKPILNSVKEREQSIENALKSAEKAREDMKSLQADNEKILKEAREERETILKEAREIRDNMISEAKESAFVEAEKIAAAAKAQIENDKNKAIHELKNQVAELSLEVAEKVLRAELADASKQKELIESTINEAKLN